MSDKPPTLWRLLGVWLSIGLQSFGGGASTFALIERAIVREHGWLTEAEYVREVALAQLSPGINLLGLTILIGRRLGGAVGVPISLIGLLLPSVAITVLMTAGYAHVQHRPQVQAALHGIIPATVGLGLWTAFGLSRSLFQAARLEGTSQIAVSILVLVGSAVALARGHLPVLLILLAAGVVGAAARSRRVAA